MLFRSECADAIRDLQKQYEQLKAVKLRLYEKYTSGSITKDVYKRQAYSLRELKTREDWNEWQANVLGAAILMPQREIDLAVAYLSLIHISSPLLESRFRAACRPAGRSPP